MINRYWGPKMRDLWDGSNTKFANWLIVELAVLGVREGLGQIPEGIYSRIANATYIDQDVVEAIERRDREIGHDLNAFVEIMRLQIILSDAYFLRIIRTESDEDFNNEVSKALEGVAKDPDAGYFHDGMTSYDTEEPAMALLVLRSCAVIDEQLRVLLAKLEELAKTYRGTVMIGRTHGQHAQPITFGVKILNWLDMARRAREAFITAGLNAKVMKLSGAVGMYGTLGSEVEKGVGPLLDDLKPVIATQIISLDYRARVVTELAFIADVVEKIADDLWHMCQTEVGEIREPFGKRQKGSSAMPHKKNPIRLENIRGFAAVVRGFAHIMMELVRTSHERDISHSGPERLVVPDAFGVVDHQLRTLVGILSRMEVFPDRMRENLNLSYGTFASQKVEMLLKQQGMAAESAYRKVQAACSTAVQSRKHLQEVILDDPEMSDCLKTSLDQLALCFDPASWIAEESGIYERAGVSL